MFKLPLVYPLFVNWLFLFCNDRCCAREHIGM